MKYLVDWDKFNGHYFHANLDWQKEKGEEGKKGGIKTSSIIYQYVQAITKLFNSITHPNETDAIALPILFMIKHGIELGMKNIILTVCAYHLFYIEKLRGEDFKSRLDAKQKAVSNKGHNLTELLALLNEDFAEFRVQVEKEYGINMSSWLQNVPVFETFDDNKSNCQVAKERVFVGDNADKINFLDVLSDFAELFNKIDPYDSAFKYQTLKKGEAALGGVGKINIELLVCYFVEISYVLSYFEEPFADFFHDYDQWLNEFEEYLGPE